MIGRSPPSPRCAQATQGTGRKVIDEDTVGSFPGYRPRRSAGEYPFIVFFQVGRREKTRNDLDTGEMRAAAPKPSSGVAVVSQAGRTHSGASLGRLGQGGDDPLEEIGEIVGCAACDEI